MLEMNLVVRFLADQWVRVFRKKPVLTMLLTTMISALCAAGITYLDHLDREKRENKRLQSLDYQTQIRQLGQMELNINQLLGFVESQKKSLQETEDAISNLKSEKEKLQPLVETDRAVVEALFKAQEDRVNSSVWRERIIGFVFGVLGSLVASFILLVARMLIRGRSGKV